MLNCTSFDLSLVIVKKQNEHGVIKCNVCEDFAVVAFTLTTVQDGMTKNIVLIQQVLP